jgi:hypothetical protein
MLTVILLIKKFLASDKLKGLLVLKDLDQAQAQALLTSPTPQSPHHLFLVLDCSFSICSAALHVGDFPHLQPEDSSDIIST